MVKHIALVVVALTAIASADESSEEANGDSFNMLGFRMTIGQLPIDNNATLVVGLGLGVEHPVFNKTRVLGEYEWLWLTHTDPRALNESPTAPERHGNGHRFNLGLRRELIGKGRRQLRVFLDGELGGGLALVNDNMTGFDVMPHGFAGLRFGYDLYSRAEDSPSRTFEAEFLLRAVAVRDGVGMLFGVGMLWGN